jgi:hypothetical protein
VGSKVNVLGKDGQIHPSQEKQFQEQTRKKLYIPPTPMLKALQSRKPPVIIRKWKKQRFKPHGIKVLHSSKRSSSDESLSSKSQEKQLEKFQKRQEELDTSDEEEEQPMTQQTQKAYLSPPVAFPVIVRPPIPMAPYPMSSHNTQMHKPSNLINHVPQSQNYQAPSEQRQSPQRATGLEQQVSQMIYPGMVWNLTALWEASDFLAPLFSSNNSSYHCTPFESRRVHLKEEILQQYDLDDDDVQSDVPYNHAVSRPQSRYLKLSSGIPINLSPQPMDTPGVVEAETDVATSQDNNSSPQNTEPTPSSLSNYYPYMRNLPPSIPNYKKNRVPAKEKEFVEPFVASPPVAANCSPSPWIKKPVPRYPTHTSQTESLPRLPPPKTSLPSHISNSYSNSYLHSTARSTPAIAPSLMTSPLLPGINRGGRSTSCSSRGSFYSISTCNNNFYNTLGDVMLINNG